MFLTYHSPVVLQTLIAFCLNMLHRENPSLWHTTHNASNNKIIENPPRVTEDTVSVLPHSLGPTEVTPLKWLSFGEPAAFYY